MSPDVAPGPAGGNRCERRLSACGIRPTAQRVRIASVLLSAPQHLSAEQILANLRADGARVSKATVYNTLNLFVEKRLLRELVLAEGRVVFDPKVEAHHHFIDETSGSIYDVPWDAVKVSNLGALRGMEVHEYQVVMRGKRLRRRKSC